MTAAAGPVQSLPRSIRIGPFDYQIEKWAPLASLAVHRWGECSSTELVLRIQVDMPSPQKAIDTFLHEVSHAIFHVFGVEDGDKEERIVGLTATAWVQVYRDNPWLLKWLAKWV